MKLLLMLLLALSLEGQLWGQERINFLAPGPEAVQASSVTARTVGIPGARTYYYWVVANYTIGRAVPAGPAVIKTANGTLNAGNFVRVSWAPLPGVLSYDVLRTNTPVGPAGTCNCAVATAIAGPVQNDISNTLIAYVVTSVGSTTGYMRLNNRDYTIPWFDIVPGINSLTVFNLTVLGAIIGSVLVPSPLVMTPGVEPACVVGTRGYVVFTIGGAGVADTLRICTKDAANVYAWRALY